MHRIWPARKVPYLGFASTSLPEVLFFLSFNNSLLDDLAHRRIVYARFPRDGCHSVAVFQARPVNCRIALRLVLSHAGRKQALQSGPMRPALSVRNFLEYSLAFPQ